MDDVRSPWVFYRYSSQTKSALRDLRHTYDGLVLSAHLLAYYGNPILVFLQTVQMPFFIDPMTYLFGLDVTNLIDEGEFRVSYGELVKSYGKLFGRCEKEGPLSSSSLASNEESRNEIAQNVLKFQEEICLGHKFDKYRRYVGKTLSAVDLRPMFIVAPYFHFSNIDDPWYDITLDIAKRSQKFKGGYKLYAVICASKEILLESGNASRIASDYAEFDGYIIWIPSFREETISEPYLVGLRKFVNVLGGNGKSVIGLSGGYYSALLSKSGISGFAAGLCYGESRVLEVPEHGRRPDPRYYMWQLHAKLGSTAANVVFSEGENMRLLCICETCEDVRRRVKVSPSHRSDYVKDFFAKMKEDEYRRHFANIRHDEITQLRKSNESQMVERLDTELKSLQATRTFSLRARTGHLESWKNALEAKLD